MARIGNLPGGARSSQAGRSHLATRAGGSCCRWPIDLAELQGAVGDRVSRGPHRRDVVGGGRAGGCSWRRISPHSVRYLGDVGNELRRGGGARTLTPAIPVRLRGAWIGWWLAVAVGAAVFSRGRFHERRARGCADAGHGRGTRFGRPSRWTPGPLFLLAVAAVFCYLIFRRHRPGDRADHGISALAAVLAVESPAGGW